MEPPIQIDSEGRKDSPRRSAVDEMGLSPHRGEEGLERLIQLLARIGGTSMAAFWVMDRERSFFAAAHGFAARDTSRLSALGEHALRQDNLVVVPDASQDPRFSSDPMVTGPARVRFFASIAVRGRDRERIGVLCLMDAEPRSQEDLARAALQDLRAVVEDRLRLRSDVLHDPQTGTLIRRHFDELGDREWRRAMRALVPISVIVAELDHLNGFAGREGVAAIDRGLRASALAIQYSLHRPGDCVSRFDDSRFAILLPAPASPVRSRRPNACAVPSKPFVSRWTTLAASC